MSVRVMSKVWDADCGSHTAKLVLLSIADHADDRGGAYPSISRIADKCGMSRRGVMKQISRLEESGLLSAKKSPGRVTKYTVQLVNVVHPCTAFTREPRSKTGEPCSKTGERGAPEPLEPSEPSKKNSRFRAPTPDDVLGYGETLSPPFRDAEQFCDFYAAKGWKVGKSPMKDWKAAVRTWHRRQKQDGSADERKIKF